MSKVKQLAKETAIYGVSSIVGRFLKWMLEPLYVKKLYEVSDYGIVTNLYAWTALLVILLTYGMETSFFRFSGKDNDDKRVYGTSLTALFSTSVLFALAMVLLRDSAAQFLGYDQLGHLVAMMAIMVGMDAFLCIPFARLRYEKRPMKFAGLKFINVFLNIGANLFFIVLCPFLIDKNPDAAWLSFYDKTKQVDYIIFSNFLASSVMMLLLVPEYIKVRWVFDKALFKKMFHYAFPILIVGIAGVINQAGDKILYPFLVQDEAKALVELGIYGANYKVAIIMVMFIQAFRFAFEPFIFNQTGGKKDKHTYAEVMRYFVIFCMTIFLGVTLFIDIVKLLIEPEYYEGLKVVPIVLMAYVFFGIFFNLSLWYKLTDKTKYGAYMAIMGAAVTLLINIIFVPHFGYIASAWANFACYFSMMVLSYTLMQKFYPVKYDLKKIALYVVVGLGVFAAHKFIILSTPLLNYLFSTLMMGAYLVFCIMNEKDLRRIIIQR
ncbi:MAG: oligosaccharide flippase family protein [Bacteroidales bacterium]|jgi:O-antigen/teichoic acid export membrane protein|nr:oligosaccharide flippase family protein [Bacteroidales bacterium]